MTPLISALSTSLTTTLFAAWNPSALHSADWVLLAGGVALLLLGKRLYWLALAGLGAAVAVGLADRFFPLPTPEGRLLLAVAAAIAGALLAVAAQRLALSILGALAGAGTVAYLVPFVWPDAGLWLIALAVVGAVIGVMLAGKLFEALLIVASSLAGAWLIADALKLPDSQELAVVAVATIVGIVVQSRGPRMRRPRRVRER